MLVAHLSLLEGHQYASLQSSGLLLICWYPWKKTQQNIKLETKVSVITPGCAPPCTLHSDCPCTWTPPKLHVGNYTPPTPTSSCPLSRYWHKPDGRVPKEVGLSKAFPRDKVQMTFIVWFKHCSCIEVVHTDILIPQHKNDHKQKILSLQILRIKTQCFYCLY